MQIMNATEEDKDELLALYHAMIGGPCEWSETYPDENTIAFDLKNEDLFVMKNDAGEIIATISIDHDDAVESLTCWHEDQAPSGELSRLCVRKDMQGQGIAKQMMNYAGPDFFHDFSCLKRLWNQVLFDRMTVNNFPGEGSRWRTKL